MKSVSAGEYTPPPAHGPRITEICGTTPDAFTFRKKIPPYASSPATPSWIRAPAPSLSPTIGRPIEIARSIIFWIFSP